MNIAVSRCLHPPEASQHFRLPGVSTRAFFFRRFFLSVLPCVVPPPYHGGGEKADRTGKLQRGATIHLRSLFIGNLSTQKTPAGDVDAHAHTHTRTHADTHNSHTYNAIPSISHRPRKARFPRSSPRPAVLLFARAALISSTATVPPSSCRKTAAAAHAPSCSAVPLPPNPSCSNP